MDAQKESSSEQNKPAEQMSLFESELGTGKLILESEELEKKAKVEAKKQEQEKLKENNPEPPKQEPKKEEPAAKPLILGRFKSQEEFVKAIPELEKKYKETEAEFTRLSQKTKELKKLESEAEKPIPPSEEPKEEEIEIDYDKLLSNPKEALRPLVMQEVRKILDSEVKPVLNPIVEKNQQNESNMLVNKFKEKHPDMEQLKGRMSEIIENDIPANANIPADKLLNIAYRMAKSEAIDNAVEQAKTQENQDELSKKEVFVEGGNGASGRGQLVKKNPEQSIKESIVAAKSENGLFT